MDKIKLIILCGKAGAGKDAILHHVMKLYPTAFNEIVSCTTRPPREGEVDGVNYHFLTIDEFTEKILNGDMLEATEFNGWHYGTMASSLVTDKINIGVFNPAGVECLLENDDLDIHVFFVNAHPKTRLIRQLNREEKPNVYEIIRRFSADEEDFIDFKVPVNKCDVLTNEEPSDINTCAKSLAIWAKVDK